MCVGDPFRRERGESRGSVGDLLDCGEPDVGICARCSFACSVGDWYYHSSCHFVFVPDRISRNDV